MKNIQKTILLIVFTVSGFLASAQTYQSGYALGQGDAQATMDLHFRLSTQCLGLLNTVSGPPSLYWSCYLPTTSEQTFINFWSGYLANVKSSYCSATGSFKDYYEGQIDGYHAKMMQLSLQYGANYFGSPHVSCN